MYQLFLSLFLFQALLARASNDWRTPCIGSCAYESGDGTKRAWSSILIDGPSQLVSDISTAAGWSIMDCDANSQDVQTIRLVCHDLDGVCDALFDGGAENTIVRLPEDCADAPFARVVSVSSSTNQTLTSKVAKRVAAAKRRRSAPPEVLTVKIDYQFNLIPLSRGTVSLTALATTNPLQRPLATTQRLRRALGYDESDSHHRRRGGHRQLVNREIRRRDLFTDFVNGNTIPAGITADAIAAKTMTTDGKLGKLGKSANGTTSKLGNWSKDWNKQFDVLDISQGFNVANVKLSCPQNGDIPAFDAKVLIDAQVDVKATVTVGFIAAGSIIPPKISKAAFTAALDGGAQASFKISADAKGTFNTGLLPLYSSGLAGLSIPGILDVGPSFSINGQGIGSIGVRTDAVVKANYNFPGLSMVFPQDQGSSSGSASQGDTQSPLTLSIGGSAQLTGSVEAHIVPRVDLGVKVLSGMASASVYLQLDGYGALNMDLKLEGSASTGVGPTQKGIDPSPSVDSTSAVSESLTASTTSSTDFAASTTESASSESSTSSSTDIATSTSSDDASDSLSSSDAKEVPTQSSTQAEISTTVLAQPTYAAPAQIDDFDPPSSVFDHPPLVDVAQISSSSGVAPSSCPSRRMRRRIRRTMSPRDVVVNNARDASGSFSGCVGVGLGVKIVAGAQGKLFDIWKASTSFDLFSQKWDIFSKCFNHNLRRDTSPFTPELFTLSSLESRQLDGSDLVCPAITDTINAINQII